MDIDGVAVRVARENVANNHLSAKIDVREGDLLHGTEGKADIIIANIIADIIIMLLPDIPGKLKENGIFLASGIIEERREDVEAAAAEQGLKVDAVDRRGGWFGACHGWRCAYYGCLTGVGVGCHGGFIGICRESLVERTGHICHARVAVFR